MMELSLTNFVIQLFTAVKTGTLYCYVQSKYESESATKNKSQF